MAYQNIMTEIVDDCVGVIQLNRPKALNALNSELMQELSTAILDFDADKAIGAMIITGNEKAFAAGADIKEMQPKTYADVYAENFITKDWETVSTVRKPVIAAVSGYALGGGCELAMMCDFIIAADNAQFGQPEINLAIIPGAGGTQRLTRLIGKSKAMDLCLTGRMMDAEEAERSGLVARIVPSDELMDSCIKIAKKIARQSQLATMKIKETVNRSYETTLTEGLLFERRNYHACFATEDQKEGMTAFMEKRKPEFKHQ